MALRNIKINLSDITKYNKDDVHRNTKTYMFVLTKKTNQQIKDIVKPIVDKFNSELISYWHVRKMINDELSEGVSPSSYKEFNWVINLEG